MDKEDRITEVLYSTVPEIVKEYYVGWGTLSRNEFSGKCKMILRIVKDYLDMHPEFSRTQLYYTRSEIRDLVLQAVFNAHLSEK